ncbi:unnamed protein product [Rhizoctonia solani]|uniref:Protein kinase domain-containing protein n=1 Tax=Rhizoctonia solani TaxID=456999 RepID=A0A8H3A6F8_9AGAM|nr:unnamed protein product [Rhizoctonia solani]
MNFWEPTRRDILLGLASTGPIPEDRRLLVRIDNALAYALRPGSDLKEFEDQVQMIQYEIQQLSKKGIGPDFTYRLTSKRDWNCYFYDLDLRDLGWKATPIGRTASGSATRYYVHTTTEPPTLVHRNESGLVSVKEVLLGFYRGAFLSRVGVLDNPTFHYTGPEYQHEWSEGQGSHPGFMRNSTYFSMTTLDIEDEGREMSSIPGPIHILVGARPRFHLLMSFELQSQLYTVIKPTQEPDVVLKDMRGALHSCADVLARHNAQGRLGWTLYQLKSNREQGMETLALQQVELPLMERQTTLAMSTGPLQSLSYAWEHIVGIEKQQGYSEISWLLEIGTIPMAIKCAQVSSGLTYLHEAKVIHGDLRAANLLVSITGEAIVSDPIILADNTLKDEHSRFRWMAPEIIKGEHQNRSSDVYSLGMVAREVVRRLALHGCENITDHIDEDSFGPFPLFRGGFGDVFRGSLLSSLRVAVKTPHISSNILGEDLQYIKATREIHTWSKCDHPNVLHFLGLVVFRDQIGMVAPWMENGSLSSYLRKTLSADRCKLCTEICEGVAYLHKIGIVHGDLKGENVLISSEGTAVVSDFGGSLLKNRSLNVVPLEKGLSLTYRWAAPELLMQDGIHEIDDEDDIDEVQVNQTIPRSVSNTKASDVYALGMTILVSG